MVPEQLKQAVAEFCRECRQAAAAGEHMPEMADKALAISSAIDALPKDARKLMQDDIEAVIAALNNYIAVMEYERDKAGDAVSDRQSRDDVCSAYAKMQKIGKYN